MANRKSAKFWTTLVLFSLIGQVAWVVENMYFEDNILFGAKSYEQRHSTYMITKGNLESTPEYKLFVNNENSLLNTFVEVEKSNSFQTIINTLETLKNG